MRRWGLILALALSGAACGDGGNSGDERECNDGNDSNSLKGSYCENTPMVYRDVKFLVVQGSKALRVEYVRTIGTGSEKTLQLIVPSDRVMLLPNTDIKLLDAGASVRRLLAEGVQDLTVEIQDSSNINFTDYTGTIGSHIAGKFALLFKNGRTLSGDFDGTIEDANPMSM